jgi:hypothetical protein
VWLLSGVGSVVWFLIRVIPKPSRAGYPCQRAAVPMASGFVVWLLALVGSRMAWRRAKDMAKRDRWVAAAACGSVALVALGMMLQEWPGLLVRAEPSPVHGPLGVGKGIHPGRVVWVHAPEATDWSGYTSATPWWLSEHTDLSVAEEMTSEAVRSLAGETTDGAAWEALFRHFNAERGRGRVSYADGEKIVIKINLTACNARSDQADANYDKLSGIRNRIDNSPQMLVALLRQLVYVVGVAPGDISVGDPTGLFANHLWEPIHGEFPAAQCFDNHGKPGSGRVRTEFSGTRFQWSSAEAWGKRADYVPVQFAEADYLINYALLKGHSAGITVCAKNHYGSLLRCPDGYMRDRGVLDYFDMHKDLPGSSSGNGMGRYRPLVDLMGHRELGGKTLLYLIDGLFAGYYWEGKPYPWRLAPFGDGVNRDWPNSLFASQDPVAIDSVAHDFLLAEWPNVVNPSGMLGAAEDYLHEAAEAGDPASGTVYDPERDGVRLSSLGVHEHWNNSVDKQYSRNLGVKEGIELVARTVTRPEARLECRSGPGTLLISWRASLEGYRLEGASDLGVGSSWAPVLEMPEYVEGLNVVTEPGTASRRFYRLIK